MTRTSVILGLGVLSAGCAEELGPVPLRVTGVTGMVREGSRPVSGGWIEFVPVDGTVGNLRSARLHPDGSFQADRVPVGVCLIRLVNASIQSPTLSRLFSASFSPIRRDIPERPGAPLALDLVDEAIQFEKVMARDRDRDRGRDASGSGIGGPR